MGLLTRALATAHSSENAGLLQRAEELRRRASPQSGAVPVGAPDSPAKPEVTQGEAVTDEDEIAFDDDSAAGEAVELDPEGAIRAILQELPELPQSIEQPAHLFRLLVENLQLRRATILIPDYDEDVFVPWASHGLDATSLHRLRIPVSDLESVAREGGAGALWSGDAVGAFAPYFSRREASMLENLLVFPIAHEEGIQAVILITETPYFESHAEYLRIILAAVAEPAARSIRNDRFAYTTTLSRSIVFKPGEIGVVAGRIASRAGGRVMILVIQLSDLVSQVATFNDYLDPFRVWQDVLRAVAGLFASTASVCDADDQRALALVHGEVGEDVELIVQHISASLATFLPEIEAAPVLRYEVRHYPEDGSDLAALVHGLL